MRFFLALALLFPTFAKAFECLPFVPYGDFRVERVEFTEFGGVYGIGWGCYPVTTAKGATINWIGGTMSLATVGTRLQAIRRAPDPQAAALAAIQAYVTKDPKTDLVLKPAYDFYLANRIKP